MPQRYYDRLAALAAHWNKIEVRLKQAEQLRHEAVLSAINELRYAGRRIVDILAIIHKPEITGKDEEAIEEHFLAAKVYLVNADHDITDAICFFAHKKISRMIEQYTTHIISIYIPDFVSFIVKVKKAQVIVSGSRGERVNRSEDYVLL